MSEEIDVPVESGKQAPIYYGINSLDERLCVTDSLPYAIERSGQAIMGYSQQSSSASTTNVQFTLNLPNLSTIIDRHIYIRTTLTWTLSGANGNAGVPFLSNGDGAGAICAWGRDMAFAPFPFQQMVQNVVVTINQQPISINLQECLPSLMRMFEKEILAESCSETPCMLDHFQSYSSGFSAVTAPLDSNVLGGASYSKALDGIKPRGSYYVTVANQGGNGGRSATVTATIVEPLLLSPFLIGYANANQQGMYGIQTISFNFTLQQPCRSIRVCPLMTNVTACNLTSIVQASTYLDVMYITPPSGSKLYLPSRNEVPYMSVESQRTSIGAINNGVTTQFFSNDYQLSKMPDKVLACVRKKFSTQTCQDSDYYLPITNVSVTFGGNSGLLASCSQHQLWQMAVRNGSNQTWDEFSGFTSQSTLVSQPALVTTCGSVAILAFGRDLAIADPFTVPGSVGSVNFQIGVTATNNTGADIAADAYEIFLVFLYGGFFVNELSTSSVVLGFVDKSTVEKVSGQDHHDQNGIRRMYGGGFMSSLGKVAKGLKPLLKPAAGIAKRALLDSSNPRANKLGNVMGSLGAGVGSGMTAGGYTAGSKGRFSGRLM